MTQKISKKPKTDPQTYRIDAEGKILGRLASQVASILRGKNLKDFQPNKLKNNKVVVSNIKKLIITGRKLRQKKYFTFTGYPGGIKTYTMDELWQKILLNFLKKLSIT